MNTRKGSACGSKSGIFKKFARRLATVIVPVALALSFESEALAAGNYYDGEAFSHLTPSAPANARSTNPSKFSGGSTTSKSGSQYIVSHYATKIASFSTPGFTKDNQHIKDYVNGNLKSGWKVMLSDGSWVNWADYTSGPLRTGIPYSADITSDWQAIIAGNFLRFRCPTCTDYAYLIDGELYGYYDLNSKLVITGWKAGFVYCPNCTPLDNEHTNLYSASTLSHRKDWEVFQCDGLVFQEVVSELPTGFTKPIYGEDNSFAMNVEQYEWIDGDSYQGVYVIPDVKDVVTNSFSFMLDPGYSTKASRTWKWPEWKAYMDKMKDKPVDDSNTGTYRRVPRDQGVVWTGSAKDHGVNLSTASRYVTSGTGANLGNDLYYIEINDKLSNNINIGFGHHLYYTYQDYINIQAFYHSYTPALCIHVGEGNNSYTYLTYNGKSIGLGGYGITSDEKCLASYQTGTLAVCADCGETIPVLIYASNETVASIRRFKTGSHYYGVCSYQAANANIGGTNIPYLKSHVENEFIMQHYCAADSINSYTLKFLANDPNSGYLGLKDKTLSNYFYQVYKEGEMVTYMVEGSKMPRSYDAYGNLAALPKTASRNIVPNGDELWNGRGYVWNGWKLQKPDGTWVFMGKDVTWEKICKEIGETNDVFATDRATITLEATWLTHERTVVTVDGDEVNEANSNLASLAPLSTYTNIKYQTSRIINNEKDKTGKATFNVGLSGVADIPATPSPITTYKRFVSLSPWKGNEGLFNASTNEYFNLTSSTTTEYIIANYAFEPIKLPSVESENAVFLGWYTEPNGKGTFAGRPGAQYTPRTLNFTLYGYWSKDNMVISASVTNHQVGTTHVTWHYNNVAVNGDVFYRIYRQEESKAKVLTTNGSELGNDVSEEVISKSLAIDGTYTVTMDGIYEIQLKGSAGGKATYNSVTADGGKGAVYTVTMLLYKGDVLKIGSGGTTSSSSYTGGTSKTNFRDNAVGAAGVGGDATTLTLTRNGTSTIVAAAGGGGGGMVLPSETSGVAIVGGNAQQTLSSSGTKTQSSDTYYPTYQDGDTDTQGDGTKIYTSISSGGGGGWYSGTAGTAITAKHEHGDGCVHQHDYDGSGVLTSGTALSDDAQYSEAGGCYTEEIEGWHGSTHSKTGPSAWWWSSYLCPEGHSLADINTTYCHECALAGGTGAVTAHYDPDGWCVRCHSTDLYGDPHTDYVCNICGYEGHDPEGHSVSSVYTCSLAGTILCSASLTWGSVYVTNTDYNLYTSSTGGSCGYNTTYVLAASFNGASNTSTSGSASIESKLLGITPNESMNDVYTEDYAAPSAPTRNLKNGNSDDAGNVYVEYVPKSNDGMVVDIYMAGASWTASTDNGTKYAFSGATHDIYASDGTANYGERVRTENDAVVVVTAGIRHYNWKITESSNPSVNTNVLQEGETTKIDLGRILLVSNLDLTQTYNKAFYLHIQAEDAALEGAGRVAKTEGNTSGWLTLGPIIVSNNPPPPVGGHFIGSLNAPTVEVKASDIHEGVYQYGTTYYVKADGNTTIRLTGTASLRTMNQSRITELSLGGGYSQGLMVMTELYNTLAKRQQSTTIGGEIGDLLPNSTNGFTITDTKTTAYQEFVTVTEATNAMTAHTIAKCLGKDDDGCFPEHDIKSTGNTIYVVGDKTAPSVEIGGVTYKGEGNTIDFGWLDELNLVVKTTDNGSGIRKVTLEMYGDYAINYAPTSRVTSDTSSKKFTVEGEYIYTLTAEDNVGNKTTIELTIKIDRSKPTIVDTTSNLEEDDVDPEPAPIDPEGNPSWPTTDTNVMWRYNWVNTSRTLAYIAKDELSGVKSLTLYESNASWGKVAKLKEAKSNDGSCEASRNLYYVVEKQGITRYIVEAIDGRGHKTSAYIEVRVDKSMPSLVVDPNIGRDYKLDHIDFEKFTIDEANRAVENGHYDKLNLTWNIRVRDTNNAEAGPFTSAKDSSGIKSATLYVYEEGAFEVNAKGEEVPVAKFYPMTLANNNEYTNEKECPFPPKYRYYDQNYTVSVNTFVDFPYSTELHWKIILEDYAGNSWVKDGGTDTIRNYLVKAVAYNVDDSYNMATPSGLSSTAYFKTGEFGYLEVWTIGYVDKLELSFPAGAATTTDIGREAYNEIAKGGLLSKYALGVHGGDPSMERFVTTIIDPRHATNSGVPDRSDEVPFATHFMARNHAGEDDAETITITTSNGVEITPISKYLEEGSDKTSGWLSDSTMMRIPPSHELKEKKKTDSNGNEIKDEPLRDSEGNIIHYWEFYNAEVYAYKMGGTGSPAKAPYVIWDESGDDVHYRLIHGTLGF